MNDEDQRRLLGEAAEWLATLHSGEVSDSERRRCEDWRQAHPDHERAFRRMETLWGRFDGLESDANGAATSTLKAVLGTGQRPRLRGVGGGGSALVAVLLLGGVALLAGGVPAPADWLADYHSPTGVQRRVALPDGSELILNTNTAVDLDYRDDERRVVLRHGELLARVAPDPARPFVVQSAAGTARALGTRYTVRAREQGMDVVVTESSVEVCGPPVSPPARSRCTATPEGHGIQVRDGRPGVARPVDTAVATAWVRHRLVADDRPLNEVLAELARYRGGLLRYDDKALAAIRVSGVFPLDNTDQALALLAAHAPIRVRHFSRFLTLISPR